MNGGVKKTKPEIIKTKKKELKRRGKAGMGDSFLSDTTWV